ncbi:MAG: cytochrome c family protein [Pseudomonadota bacterium]
MDTMEITKIFGSLCGSLLIFLLISTASDAIYSGGHGHHEAAYVIEVPESAVAEVEEADEPEVDFETLLASADISAGERTFRACAACHKLEDGANGVGPHLYGIVGRNISAVDGFAYSGALVAQAEVWTAENLSAFLEAPSDWAPGTKMSYRGLREAEDRANLISYLDSIDD